MKLFRIVCSSVLLLAWKCQEISAFSVPSDGFVKIHNWEKQVSEPPTTGGRRYGPNWSLDPSKLTPMETTGETGALVWAIGNSTYVHPELRPDFPVGQWLLSRPNLGICMSGGGQRAATCALGWFRALSHLDLLSKARYVGANSGATWTTLPLFCRQVLELKDNRTAIDYNEFLGKYMGKDYLLEDKTQLGEIGVILTNANVMNYKKNKEKVTFNDWCDAIDQNYVEPIMGWKSGWKSDFWLDLSNAYLWNTKATDYILGDETFPFPIFVATGYEESNNQQFMPIENTPLYSGIPVDPRKLGIETNIGGGFVQGVALNAEDLENTHPVPVEDENLYLKNFKNPSKVVKVAELTGASSDFAASGDAMIAVDLQNVWKRNIAYWFAKLIKPEARKSNLKGYFDPGRYKWWSPTTGGEPVDLAFVDGGMYDNLGVLAVLRRGCSTVIVCNACDADVVKTKGKDVYVKFYDVAALFGVSLPILPEWLLKDSFKGTVNKRSKVFDSDQFDVLMKKMRELRLHRKPLVVRMKLKLNVNELAGIYESRDVDMIFCFNGVVLEFDSDEDFPYIDTTKCNYSVQEVNKLSSLASYNLVEGMKNAGFDISQVCECDF